VRAKQLVYQREAVLGVAFLAFGKGLIACSAQARINKIDALLCAGTCSIMHRRRRKSGKIEDKISVKISTSS
jgi:hypothetical protein